jgi:apolipoprotein N-acyltransferase
MADTVAASPSGRAGSHPAVLGLASGVLLWFAFPPAGWSWLGWVALAPLFLLISSRRSRASIYLGAWFGGLAFWLLALSWILCIDPQAALGWGVMALVLSTLWPIFLGLSRLAVNGLGLPVTMAAPIVWTAIEYVRAYMFTGFPWYYLAHTQYRQLPLIQIADFSGALGLTFLMAAASALLADALTLPIFRKTPRGPRLTPAIGIRLGCVAAGLVATLGYGLFRLNTARFEPGPRVALLQTNLMQRYKSDKKYEELIAIYAGLVKRAAESSPKPDLIVWPETAYPNGFVVIDPELAPADFAKYAHAYDPDPERSVPYWLARRNYSDGELYGWVGETKIPMMVGVTTYHFRPGGLNRYNSAVLIEPTKKPVQSYHKLHLVPFGEYVPLLSTFPWLTALTPYRNGYVPSLTFGEHASWFDEGKYRYATAICFEDTVPQVTRRLFREVPDGRSPDVLLNLSNDGWFTTLDVNGQVRGSSEHEMHLAGSVFRAVEHRVPLARAANTGISAVVDGNGKVVASIPAAKEGVLVESVPLDPRTGLYTSWGDWVGQGCLAITIGLYPLARWRRRKSRAAVV